jgi:hypothetical protein
MNETSVSDGPNVWLKLAARGVRGEGKLLPRLVFEMETRTPRERMQTHIQHLRARLLIAGEVAGTGSASGIIVGPYGNSASIEIPISPNALDYAEAQLTNDRLYLTLAFSGVLWSKDDNTDRPPYASRPSPGEWTAVPFGGSAVTSLDFEIARSDWYSRIREPLGTLRYLFVELPLPKTGHPLRKAAERLRDAEQALTAGDEPGVFLHCRGAVDALPGSPKNIFDGLSDAREADALDALVMAAGTYLHRGRHVDRSGSQQGDFPVTGRDARFALNLTKVLISHVAGVVAPE